MNELSSSLDSLTGELNSSTIPGNESLLPRDLGNVNYLLENIVETLPVQILQTVSRTRGESIGLGIGDS